MTKPSTIKAIYKCLLQDAKALQRTPHFRLRNALQLEHWGVGHYVPPRSSGSQTPSRIRSLADYLSARERGFRYEDAQEDVVKVIRECFKANLGLSEPKAIAEKLDEAIHALQEVSNQLLLAQCSSVTTTHGIRIEATSQYVPSHSNPQQNLFRYTYRVTITNENEEGTVQITGRQYSFESERGQRIALPPHSPGIVGNTPVLQPGQTFEYASGVDIDSPRGFVTGCLHLIRRGDDFDDDRDIFDADVAKFNLLASHK
ncbi:hypothetical protein Poli38472_002127 [Pythium oligandrum]|uniref:ApaG domain-containing protein n=1 Tax=Pythium oligandrum TaxID=41045 RepID=A0A8K1CGN6_PYTOL|nr:hypothetical protein Poli38472_002127 [Pythium oligandrum]|eukprot:TMW63186.1 hypothetical protein Poli38472_002127 [Pythium oligandrum]